jgi:hypothetical protein
MRDLNWVVINSQPHGWIPKEFNYLVTFGSSRKPKGGGSHMTQVKVWRGAQVSPRIRELLAVMAIIRPPSTLATGGKEIHMFELKLDNQVHTALLDLGGVKWKE